MSYILLWTFSSWFQNLARKNSNGIFYMVSEESVNVKVATSNTMFRKESTLDPEKLAIQYKFWRQCSFRWTILYGHLISTRLIQIQNNLALIVSFLISSCSKFQNESFHSTRLVWPHTIRDLEYPHYFEVSCIKLCNEGLLVVPFVVSAPNIQLADPTLNCDVSCLCSTILTFNSILKTRSKILSSLYPNQILHQFISVAWKIERLH